MYIGRFAHSPTGPLHLGSIMIAIASFLEAKVNNGLWHLKIDDLDHFRVKQEYINQIKEQLLELNLSWDGEIIFQSKRIANYNFFLHKIESLRRTYICTCSRKKILTNSEPGIDGGIYPGTCRHKNNTRKKNHAIRVLTNKEIVALNDGLQGHYEQDIEKQIGDFIIKRSDNIVSYQLAVIVDDYLDKTTHILRGADLLESTPRQIYLQKILSLPQINYIHLPTLNIAGRKLSKSNGDDLMYKNDPKKIWLTVLKFLDQKIPPKNLTLNEIIEFAIKNWCVKNIKSKRFIDIDDYIHTS